MARVVVLHSGGLDSTVCVAQAVAAGHEVFSLGVDYGQRHRLELEFAKDQCRKMDVERQVIRVEWTKPERVIPKNRSVDEIKSGVSVAFLPGRNIVFFSLAIAHAAGLGAEQVWTGVNAIDFSGYPDCTPNFVDSYVQMLNEGSPGGPRLMAPLLNNSKEDIANMAHSLGLRPGDTWSCYTPSFHEHGVSPCGLCDACVLHNDAWNKVLASS